MFVPGPNVIEISVAPRIERERTRVTPGTMLTASHDLPSLDHVRARSQRSRAPRGPADRARRDAPHAGHNAHGLLEGPRDAEHHLARAQRRSLGDDRDAGEPFGIAYV